MAIVVKLNILFFLVLSTSLIANQLLPFGDGAW